MDVMEAISEHRLEHFRNVPKIHRATRSVTIPAPRILLVDPAIGDKIVRKADDGRWPQPIQEISALWTDRTFF